MSDGEILLDNVDLIEFTLGHVDFINADGLTLIIKDYRIKGEVWRVHKGDADPFPSRPHAHCIAGRGPYQGGKLHLGTSELFKGAKATGLYYPEKHFSRLCALIQPKFPDITLPLSPT